MTTHDESDCIAMSEEGDWYAFPKTMKRGQVMAALAEGSAIAGGDWAWFLTHHTIRAGHVHRPEEPPEDGWWEECDEGAHGAMPAWIVRRSARPRGVS